MLNNPINGSSSGWLSNGSVLKSTGMAVGTIISLFSPVTDANIGTAGSRYIELNTAIHSYDANKVNLKVNSSASSNYRTPQENLSRIRAILKTNVSDLANVFGVSRQAIYNWVNGEQPVSIYADKLHDLALAADLFASEGIVLNGHIMKRAIANGKTLLETSRSGDSAKDAAYALIRILNRESEQRKILNARLANRGSSVINPAEFGIPVCNEQS